MRSRSGQLGSMGLAILFASAVPAQETPVFTFSKVDVSLLEQVELLDRKFDREGLVLHDEKLGEYVSRVGRAMLPTSAAPERVKWEFRVLRDPMPNAFALSNGSIYVNTGLLSLLENEDQLASVLAHEITHVTDRHSYLHFRSYRKKAAIANVVSAAASYAPSGELWGAAVRVGASVVPIVMSAMINGYSRELERNADVYSFNKLAEGAYDPREMPNVFRLLQRKDEVEVEKVYYNDHPKLEERVSYTTGLVATKAPKPVEADVAAERKLRYQQLTESAVREDIGLAILSNRPRTALARARKLAAFNPKSADNICALGEAYRALGPWTPELTPQDLTGDAKKDAVKMKRKFTAEEERQTLLAKDAGQKIWRENQKSSEESYKQALALDPNHPKTHRGLAQLLESSDRKAESLAAYRKYLELQPNALDRQRVVDRIDSLKRSTGEK